MRSERGSYFTLQPRDCKLHVAKLTPVGDPERLSPKLRAVCAEARDEPSEKQVLFLPFSIPQLKPINARWVCFGAGLTMCAGSWSIGESCAKGGRCVL